MAQEHSETYAGASHYNRFPAVIREPCGGIVAGQQSEIEQVRVMLRRNSR